MGSCVGQLVLANRPLPSSKNPHFQNEAKCTTFLVKMSFICMRMKNHFHIKGWALNLVLIQRTRGTRKLPIVLPRPLLQSQQSLRKLTSPSFPLVSKVRMKRPVTCMPSRNVGWSGWGVIYTLSEFYFYLMFLQPQLESNFRAFSLPLYRVSQRTVEKIMIYDQWFSREKMPWEKLKN